MLKYLFKNLDENQYEAYQQVILAEAEKDWLIRDWDKPFDIVDGHSVNLGEMLKAKGVK